MKTYYVYIVTNRKRGVLYTGMTNDLEARIWDHKNKLTPGFTSRYNCSRLVYYEDFNDVWEAIAREKQIKGWRRARKIELIESANPDWKDLSDGWYD